MKQRWNQYDDSCRMTSGLYTVTESREVLDVHQHEPQLSNPGTWSILQVYTGVTETPNDRVSTHPLLLSNSITPLNNQ